MPELKWVDVLGRQQGAPLYKVQLYRHTECLHCTLAEVIYHYVNNYWDVRGRIWYDPAEDWNLECFCETEIYSNPQYAQYR